jgi:hypothetical protein
MTTQSVASTSNPAHSNKNVGAMGADGNSSIHSSSVLGSSSRAAGGAPNAVNGSGAGPMAPNTTGATGHSENSNQKSGSANNAPHSVPVKTEMMTNNNGPNR